VQPALGLLGTVLGLCLMGENFSDALSATNPTAGMKEALKGLGVAFGTTLVGCLCGSLVLSGLAHTADRAIERLIAQVGALADLRREP
jgi:biopolymer transport protein ExbB/TolQ